MGSKENSLEMYGVHQRADRSYRTKKEIGGLMICTKSSKKAIRETQITAYVCDRCKRRVKTSDTFEIQEFLHWHTVGGYASIFGDGAEVSIDLCQHCTKDILGEWIRIK